MRQNYNDKFLHSLLAVFTNNPKDLNFKKYFAFELLKRGELEDAYELLLELSSVDNDLNITKALKDLETKLPKSKTPIGFFPSDDSVESLREKIPELKKRDTITFFDVAGMDHVKEAIRVDIIYPFQHPEVYKQYNKKSGGGILLFGPPGCGKTFIARATAGEINANFISVSIHELISPLAGAGEQNLHEVFQRARENTPVVLFFDEVDAIGMSRSKTASHMRTLVNQFLTELDGINSENEGVLVIGATNLPWEVDPALRRPGRFDKILFVPPPDKKAREHIFSLELREKPIGDLDFVKLAEMTKRYSSADIAGVCDRVAEETFKKAIKSGEVEKITQELFEEVIKGSRSSITDWFSTVKNYIQYSNESGLFNSVKDYLDNLKDD